MGGAPRASTIAAQEKGHVNTRFIDIIGSAGSPVITVVGDLILDTYITGRTSRISPEAPIQVLEVEGDRNTLGGAANVASNLNALGAEVECCGVVGDDQDGEMVIRALAERGIGTSAVIRDPSRPTVCKTRVVSHNQQLLRIDRERRRPLDEKCVSELLSRSRPQVRRAAAMVISDYAKGTLTPQVLEALIGEARRGVEADPSRFGVLVDPKGVDYRRYRGARLITPNRREAEQYTRLSLHTLRDLNAAARTLRRDVGVTEVVITLGEEGIFFSGNEEESRIIPARVRSVYDVTGAGDTVISLLALFLSTGCSMEDAIRIANVGAGIVVGRLGVASPTRQELQEAFSNTPTRAQNKIVSRSEAARRAAQIRQRGGRLVFTNGCFDLIHGGHLEFLRSAKAFGDALMVAVNDDESVRRLKGPSRPILELAERQEILAAFQMVDLVVAFGEDTPLEIIQEISPQILVKGEDWREKGVVGSDWVTSHGGQVQLVRLREGRSTSTIIDKILEVYGGERHGQD